MGQRCGSLPCYARGFDQSNGEVFSIALTLSFDLSGVIEQKGFLSASSSGMA